METVVEVVSNSPITPVKERQSVNARDRVLVSVNPMNYDTFRLSKTEMLVCEVWAETGSLKACIEACWSEYRRKIRHSTINHWLNTRPLVKEYVMKLLDAKGKSKMTREEWEAGMVGIVKDDKKVNRTTPMMYKLIGEARGWFEKESNIGISGRNVMVQILQADGRV